MNEIRNDKYIYDSILFSDTIEMFTQFTPLEHCTRECLSYFLCVSYHTQHAYHISTYDMKTYDTYAYHIIFGNAYEAYF